MSPMARRRCSIFGCGALFLCAALMGCNRFATEPVGKTSATVDSTALEVPPQPELPPKRPPSVSSTKDNDPLSKGDPGKPADGFSFGFGSDPEPQPRNDLGVNDDVPPWWNPGEGPELFPDPIPFEKLGKPLDPPPEAKDLARIPDPETGEPLDMWVDAKNKRIVLAGMICKRAGPMELFACPSRSKEHEAIVSIRTKCYAAHAVLMAMGIKPGWPVQFFPHYRRAIGPEVEVKVAWTDEDGKRRSVPAQEWLRNKITGKQLQHPWIFAGSDFWVSEDGSQRYYLAEDGDFICVSNFTSAMLDLPIKSSEGNNALLFDAFTDRIPPVGTEVAVILTPKPWTQEPFIAPTPPLREPLTAPPPRVKRAQDFPPLGEFPSENVPPRRPPGT